jgi:hypothetical protein
MIARPAEPPRAIDCRYLRRTIDASRADGPVICLCDHPVRSGFDCVGPFLEDLPTECGLWEEKIRDVRAPSVGSR